MLSLDNVFDRDELLAWHARIERVITDPVGFVGEPKLDGLAMSLLYEDGRLVRVADPGRRRDRRRRHRQRRHDRGDSLA